VLVVLILVVVGDFVYVVSNFAVVLSFDGIVILVPLASVISAALVFEVVGSEAAVAVVLVVVVFATLVVLAVGDCVFLVIVIKVVFSGSAEAVAVLVVALIICVVVCLVGVVEAVVSVALIVVELIGVLIVLDNGDCEFVVLDPAVVLLLYGIKMVVLAVALLSGVVILEVVVSEISVPAEFVMMGEIVVRLVSVFIDSVFMFFDVTVVLSVSDVEVGILLVSLVFCVVVFLVDGAIVVIGNTLLVVDVVAVLFVLAIDDCVFLVVLVRSYTG